MPPHSTTHPALPPHFAVQPPSGHLTLHVLLPSHVMVEPFWIVTLQLLPPEHVTVLFSPVVRLHVLVPAHDDVQFAWHVPSQVDCAAHVVVQPVPQVESHVFFESQWYVTSFGGGVPPSTTPPSPPTVPSAPKVHLPPVLHVQVLPLQSQSPVHEALEGLLSSLPPQPIETPNATATRDSEPTSIETRDLVIG